MNNLERLRRAGRAFFTKEDICRLLRLSSGAAAVFCARAVKRGDLQRVKRGIYLIPGTEGQLAKEEFYKLANYLVSPSYISLQTTLAHYDISTQIIPFTIESLCLKRCGIYEAGGIRFLFWQTQKRYFGGFQKMGDFFIAEPEKAIVDIANLVAFGRYAVDLSAISFNRFDWVKINEWSKNYSLRTKKLLKEWRDKYART